LLKRIPRHGPPRLLLSAARSRCGGRSAAWHRRIL